VRRLALAALGSLVLAAASSGSIVSAGALAIPPLDVYPRQGCVEVRVPDDETLAYLILRTASGDLKEIVESAPQGGRVFACFETRMRPGDRLEARQGSARRSVRVRDIRLGQIDRVGDVIRGVAPAARTVRLSVSDCPLDVGSGAQCPDALVRRVPVTRGRFHTDTTGSLDLRGFHFVDVMVRADSGDRFRDGKVVPAFAVSNLGGPYLGGVMPPGGPFLFRLHAVPGGPVIAVASMAGQDDIIGVFRDGGTPVPVQVGNHIVSTFATDARMRVPPMITAVDSVANTVSARCFPRTPYRLYVNPSASPPHAYGFFRGTSGPDGGIVVDTDAGQSPLDLVSGHVMQLRCRTVRGDTIDGGFTAP
jgi:hypothetical protein